MNRVRGLAARTFFVAVIALQLYATVRGYSDPTRKFAFQPFQESSDYRVEVVRVTKDGRRIPVLNDWARKRWLWYFQRRRISLSPDEMVHANTGIGATLLRLQSALDWVAANTPEDRETLFYEAEVEYLHNGHGPYVKRLVSRKRELE